MTDLTEYSWYYCKMKNGDIEMHEYGAGYFLSGDVPLLNNEVESVLVEVPSYEKYTSLVNWKEDLTTLCTAKERIIEKYENIDTWWKAQNAELKEENTKLKELLKECRDILLVDEMNATSHYKKALQGLLTKINQVLGEE